MVAAGSSRLPNWFIREVDGLTSIERMIWVVLSNRAGTTGWNLNASDIAREAGCAERSVYPALTILEHCGLIVRTRRGRETGQVRNRYRVVDERPALPSPDELARIRTQHRKTARGAVSSHPETAPRAVSARPDVQSHTAPCAVSDCTTCRRKETQETQEMTPPSAASSDVSRPQSNSAQPAAPAAPLRAPRSQTSELSTSSIDAQAGNWAARRLRWKTDDARRLLDAARIKEDAPDPAINPPDEIESEEHLADYIEWMRDSARAELERRGDICRDVLEMLADRSIVELNPAITIYDCLPAESGQPRVHITAPRLANALATSHLEGAAS